MLSNLADSVSLIPRAWANFFGFSTDRKGQIKGLLVVGVTLGTSTWGVHCILRRLMPLEPPPPPTARAVAADDNDGVPTAVPIARPADHDDEHDRLQREYDRKNTLHWRLVIGFAVTTFCATSALVVQREKFLMLQYNQSIKIMKCLKRASALPFSTSYAIVHNDTRATITVDGHHTWGMLGGALKKTDTQVINSGDVAIIQANIHSWGVGRGVSLSTDNGKTWIDVDHGGCYKASEIFSQRKY